MKYIKFHKFVCKHDRNNRVRSDIYLNTDKINFVEEEIDDGRTHACVSIGVDDYIDLFESVEDVMKALEGKEYTTSTNTDTKKTDDPKPKKRIIKSRIKHKKTTETNKTEQ